MNDTIQPKTVKRIRSLYERSPDAKALFDWTASLERDATETSIDRMVNMLEVSRNAAVTLARELEEAGCGDFIVGRKGYRSRFGWSYSRISLGRVAAGETEEIENVTDPISEMEEEASTSKDSAQPLTIHDAKILLAASLGLKPQQIEIKIRA